MAEHVTLVTPYAAPAQQRQADFMGMYVFLGAEAMFFGGIFALVFAYRVLHPDAVAEAARDMQLWIATANTGLLLTSSLFVAFAVHAARAGARRAVAGWFAAAMVLGLAFLALKGLEYWKDYSDGLMPLVGPQAAVRARPAALFIDLYFVATALHAVHMIAGLATLGAVTVLVLRGAKRMPDQAVVVEMSGLYWHFVDVVWVFVFPLFYLARG